jgi:hypothetical protein|tara:strand:- start:37 stop:345 length:309 start_codon:yes stop_codon:yes gene_type:complete
MTITPNMVVKQLNQRERAGKPHRGKTLRREKRRREKGRRGRREGEERRNGRLADMATSIYHSIQTHGVGSGHLVFVRQGMGGAISLMIVATREDTLLVRASG